MRNSTAADTALYYIQRSTRPPAAAAVTVQPYYAYTARRSAGNSQQSSKAWRERALRFPPSQPSPARFLFTSKTLEVANLLDRRSRFFFPSLLPSSTPFLSDSHLPSIMSEPIRNKKADFPVAPCVTIALPSTPHYSALLPILSCTGIEPN
jgi:hypothetical protein